MRRSLLSLLFFSLASMAPGLSLASMALAQDDAPPPEAAPEEPAPAAEEPAAPEPEEAAATPSEADDDAIDEAAREAAIETLRTAHIGDLAARSRTAVHASRPMLRVSGDITNIERSLPGVERNIARLAHPARLARIPRLPQRELVDARAEWRRHANVLEEWQRTLGERIAELEEARTTMVELRREWAELRDVSDAAGRPAERHERIVTMLQETRDSAAAMDEARDRYSALGDRISELQIVAEDVVDQLRDAATAYHERLLIQDSPPIYQGLTRETEGASLLHEARTGLMEHTDTPIELLQELWPQAVGLAFAFSLLVALLYALARTRAPTLGPPDEVVVAQPAGPFAREVLKRPFASAALLALLAATFLLEHAPIIVYDAIFFATLIPLWRAVPPLTSVVVRPLVRGAIVFVALHRLQAMLPEGTSLLRIVLLIEGAIGVGAMAWWLRFQHREAHARESTGEGKVLGAAMARGLTVLTLIGLSVALAVNLAGYVFLATVLSRGAGMSAYAALSLSGAVIVAEAVLDLLVVSPWGQHLRSFREHAGLVRRNWLRLLSFVAVLLWVSMSLAGYGLLTPLETWAEDFLSEPHTIGTLELSLGEVLGAIVILILTSYVLRFVRFELELDVLPRMKLEPGVDGAISGLTRYAIGGLGGLFALAYLGIDAEQIALVAGALGVGIGFGLQNIVANFIAGVMLMIERPVRIGDFIEVGTLVGVVRRIGLRSSTVRAADGAEVIVPNEKLISREVVNWTLTDRRRRVAVKVAVPDGIQPEPVMALLKKVVGHAIGSSKPEDVEVNLESFGKGGLEFTALFWAASFEDSVRLKSEVSLAVHEAIKREHLDSLPPPAPATPSAPVSGSPAEKLAGGPVTPPPAMPPPPPPAEPVVSSAPVELRVPSADPPKSSKD